MARGAPGEVAVVAERWRGGAAPWVAGPSCSWVGVPGSPPWVTRPVAPDHGAAGAPVGGSAADAPLRLVNLPPLMQRTTGSADVVIGLVDGPVHVGHPALVDATIRAAPGGAPVACTDTTGAPCVHGTAVAGILVAVRGEEAPSICPACPLVVRVIFPEAPGPGPPTATPGVLAAAIVDCVEAGARVLNVSSAIVPAGGTGDVLVRDALDVAMARGAIVVAATGNEGAVGRAVLTGHPAVLPVVACDREGWPMGTSNLGPSVGRRGLRAPGDGIATLAPHGASFRLWGTSAATPFVTGALALLWSLFPAASASDVRTAALAPAGGRAPRRSIVPPLLDAGAARLAMEARHGGWGR